MGYRGQGGPPAGRRPDTARPLQLGEGSGEEARERRRRAGGGIRTRAGSAAQQAKCGRGAGADGGGAEAASGAGAGPPAGAAFSGQELGAGPCGRGRVSGRGLWRVGRRGGAVRGGSWQPAALEPSFRALTPPSSAACPVGLRSLLSRASPSSSFSSELPPRSAATSCGAEGLGYAPGPAAPRQRGGKRTEQTSRGLEGSGAAAAFLTVDLGRPGGRVRKRGGEGLPRKRLRRPAGGRTAEEGVSGTFGTPSLGRARPLYRGGGPATRRGSPGALRKRKWTSLRLSELTVLQPRLGDPRDPPSSVVGDAWVLLLAHPTPCTAWEGVKEPQ